MESSINPLARQTVEEPQQRQLDPNPTAGRDSGNLLNQTRRLYG